MADSELLLTALERRLQIDRTLSLSPLRPVASPSDSPRSARAPITSATPAPREAAPTLAARLPLGQIVSARVVEVPHADHVIAEVDRWRIELAWPKGNGPTPSPGQDIDLRVLAHRPMLLFQSVLAEPDTATLEDLDRDASASTHLSSNALQLQRQAVAQSAAPGTSSGPGPLRFTIPILEIERVLLDDSPREDIEDPQVGHAVTQSASNASTASPTLTTNTATTMQSASGQADRIGLDDVIVARSSVSGDGSIDAFAAPYATRALDDAGTLAATTMPLVLQGPAWPGQPMELVVRRERADEQFENPVLDRWCGEIVIDLPNLGRVSGHLALSMQGLRIRLEGEAEAGVSSMSAGSAELATALASIDLRVASLSVGHPAADATRASGNDILATHFDD